MRTVCGKTYGYLPSRRASLSCIWSLQECAVWWLNSQICCCRKNGTFSEQYNAIIIWVSPWPQPYLCQQLCHLPNQSAQHQVVKRISIVPWWDIVAEVVTWPRWVMNDWQLGCRCVGWCRWSFSTQSLLSCSVRTSRCSCSLKPPLHSTTDSVTRTATTSTYSSMYLCHDLLTYVSVSSHMAVLCACCHIV